MSDTIHVGSNPTVPTKKKEEVVKHIKVWHLVFGFLIASFLGLNIGISCLNHSESEDPNSKKERWVEKCSKEETFMCSEGQSVAANTCRAEIYADRYVRCSNVYKSTH